jgi:Zn-finger protein
MGGTNLNNSYKFFQNKECKYFPCHKTSNPEGFNCLFCYCPLYTLKNCGGGFTILESGIKNCSNCLVPHSEGGYDYIIKKFPEIVEVFKKQSND